MTRFLSIAAFALIGCTDAQQAELEDQRAAWEAARPADYQFTQRFGCFCEPATTDPVRVTVVEDAVTSAVYDDGATTMTPGDPVAESYEVFTIDTLFDRAEAAVDEADEVEITYDADLGFPTLIDIDWLTNAIDDEEAIGAGEFNELLPPG